MNPIPKFHNLSGLARHCSTYERLLCALMMAAFTAVFLQTPIDDAFITFRYGYNLIEHGIWNWNPDKEYVEAYTNFSYAALSAIPHALGIPTLLFMKGLGLVFLILMVARVRSICRDAWIRFAATLFLVANPYVYIHCFSGMETPLFMLLLLELFVQTDKAWDGATGYRRHYHYALMLLLPLTRPEGAVFSAIAFLTLACRRREALLRDVWLWLLIAAGIGYFLWRYAYFGFALPNTFYLKSRLSTGSVEAVFNLLDSRYYLAALAVMLIAVRDRKFMVAAGAVLLVHMACYVFSKLAMNYGYRFFIQLYLPLLLYGCHFFAGNVWPAFRRGYGIVALLIALLPAMEPAKIYEIMIDWNESQRSYRDIGQTLARYRSDGHTLMVGEAGAIPYYSGWKTYDFGGLGNTHIAHEGNSLAYMQRIQPDLLLLYATGSEPQYVMQARDYGIMTDYMRGHGGYAFIGAIQSNRKNYLAVFMRRGITHFDALRQDLNALSAKAAKDNASADIRVYLKRLAAYQYMDYPNPQ